MDVASALTSAQDSPGPAAEVSADLLDQLRRTVDDRGFVVGEALEPYSHDATFITCVPAVVLLPRSAEQVVQIMRICSATGIPVVARGAGTSLVGGPVPLAGGVVLSLERMDTIEVDAANACAVVGPGAINGHLQQAAGEHGLMYPPDPGSVDISTIGGNVACNAGGMSCLKYGVTADYVLGMTVVLADGTILRLGGRTRKRASGYRLAQLFVGSEGTLGVITEICLKLIPRPKHRSVGLVTYPSAVAAGEAVARLLGSGRLPCALELMDRGALEMVSAHLPADLAPDLAAILIIEQDGSDSEMVMTELQEMVGILGGIDNRIALDAVQRERLWGARRNIGKVLMGMRQNFFAEDISVPIARIPEMLASIELRALDSGLRIPVVGHAGDGNLHPMILFDDADRDKVGPIAAGFFSDAVALGGSISAEHGLGALKRDHASSEHDEPEMELMRAIKKVLDPSGILNPHKIFPEGPADGGFLDRQPGWGVKALGERERAELGA
ncbi:MAG: FAD-binding oxidoreductase [Candidatus Dormibacteria bacterium]